MGELVDAVNVHTRLAPEEVRLHCEGVDGVHANRNDALATILRSLDELTNWEQRSPQASTELGLGPIGDLLGRLQNPHRQLRIIHVAGTKGKGSTCALIEAGLIRAGLRTGRYASPHVESVTERVSLSGAAISRDALAKSLERAQRAYVESCCAATAGRYATWFDLFTAGAFLAFRDADVEWAVLEVGLGGRLDSTNIVEEPEVVVVTNIGLEHTAILGHSREQIVREKAGIIKRGVPVATWLSETDPAGVVLREVAAKNGCTVFRPSDRFLTTIRDQNSALAALALDLAGQRPSVVPSRELISSRLLDSRTINAVRLPGRLEVFAPNETGFSVPIVLDGAHVPFNLEAVPRDLDVYPMLAGCPLTAVVALTADKDLSGFMTVLACRAQTVICTTLPNITRNRSAEDLRTAAEEVGLTATVITVQADALSAAIEAATASKGWVLVTGSLALVGLVRPMLVVQNS